MRVGTVKVSSMTGKGKEFADMTEKEGRCTVCARDQAEGELAPEHWRWVQTILLWCGWIILKEE